MELIKRQRLEAAGWKVGTVAELLDTSVEEMELIEIRLTLKNPGNSRKMVESVIDDRTGYLDKRENYYND
jgi:hypothetical protein